MPTASIVRLIIFSLILKYLATIKALKFQKETRLIEMPMCLILTIIFMILCNTGEGISKIEAIILLILFIIFIVYTIIMGKKGEQFDKEDTFLGYMRYYIVLDL